MKPKSIVHKARAYVLAILVFLCAAIVLEWRGLMRVEAEIGDLSERAAPLLSETGELARIATQLRALSEATRIVPDMRELNRLQSQLGDLWQEVGAHFEHHALTDTMLSSASTSFAALLAKQTQVLQTREQVGRKILQSLDILRDLTRGLEVREQPHLLALMLDSRGSADDAPRSVVIDDLLTVSEMKVSLARLSMLVSGMTAPASPGATETRDQVLREVGVLATRMTRLRDAALRGEVADKLARFREAMLGEAGMIATMNALAETHNQRDHAFAETASFVNLLTDTLGHTSSQVSASFEQATGATEKTIGQLLNQKLVLTSILVVLIAVFAWSVIERGLVSRIVGLTDHVRRLGLGDFSTPITRSGQDEVGEIEDAVERSRLTSEALRRSNEELERFAYVAAHDIRSPLRAVSDLVTWTQEDYGSSLPEGAHDNLDLIAARVTRLSEHLAALLEYARAGQAEQNVASFDLNEFADELRGDFLQSGQFDLVVASEAARFDTYVMPVKTILLNLVSNAVKHHDQPKAHISLSVEEEGSDIVLRVQDDGPGIAPEHHDRVFKLFQTLGMGPTCDSTGLGLALVQKLAESLDGKVTITSDPALARGTLFTVRLPKSPKTSGSAPMTEFDNIGKAA